MTDAEVRLRRKLADASRILFRLGLVDYMGHVSVRLPGTDQVLIKPQHSLQIRSQDRLVPKDLLVIDLDGNIVSGEMRPPSERFIHTEIYRARSDVRAVVHTHQPMATVMGIAGAPILPILHVEGVIAERGVPVWPHAMLVTQPDLGRDVAATLGDRPVCGLQGHGVVSVAPTIEEATIGAIWLERLAEANWRVLSIGAKPRIIPDEELRQRSATGVGWEVRWAYYREAAECDE